ncbi:MAG: aminotransferase class V-fold PLP-dependent enzyme [Phycisphaerae bacterium]|nr:aminotransferase class V-fold PLP-dependent enzyme [Phycisphaerae bacterium]
MSTITYLDNNATTRPDERVVQAMLPLLTERWGNPSSGHHFGAQVAGEIEEARTRVAGLIGARDSEIVFTSGGTEADNTALRGVLAADPAKRHLIVSAVEHHAVLETAERLEYEGVTVTRIGVDREGRLDLAALEAAIRSDTALISVMLANNETGVILPLREVCQIAQSRGVPVHTDAVNALGKMPVSVDELGVALLSLSSHKIYGPKGVGALYVRRGTPFRAWQTGGSQERQRRGGTLNAPGIVGLGVACQILQNEGAVERTRIAALRTRLEAELRRQFANAHIIGGGAERLPNTTLVCFEGVASEALLMLLSDVGICASGGAACASGSQKPSHVLKAMGIPAPIALGEVRFSLGRFNTDADLDRLFQILPGALRKVAAL